MALGSVQDLGQGGTGLSRVAGVRLQREVMSSVRRVGRHVRPARRLAHVATPQGVRSDRLTRPSEGGYAPLASVPLPHLGHRVSQTCRRAFLVIGRVAPPTPSGPSIGSARSVRRTVRPLLVVEWVQSSRDRSRSAFKVSFRSAALNRATMLEEKTISVNQTRGAWMLADAAVLLAIGGLVAWLVAQAHALTASHWLAAVAGVPLAMFAQFVTASLLGVWLGSIETKVPSLVAARLASATVCLGSLVTVVDPSAGAITGALIGTAVFADVRRYARTCPAAVSASRREGTG